MCYQNNIEIFVIFINENSINRIDGILNVNKKSLQNTSYNILHLSIGFE